MGLKEVEIFTDGACRGNPGPGGYGVILRCGTNEKELSEGFCDTTNNRMELLAAIMGLKSLKQRCRVTLYSDSQYLVNGIEKGWAKKWRANNWIKSDKKPALNSDLWDELLKLTEQHEVKIIWVKGHEGHAENERCDRLAVEAALACIGSGTKS
jgi:ribonuclease HI